MGARRIRQLYLYGISAVSLLLFATGIENLTRLLIQTALQTDPTPWLWLNRGQLRQQVSFFVALTVIGGPVWIGHWWLANGKMAPADRVSILRRFYLYLVMAGALIFFLPGAIGLARLPFWALLGATLDQPYGSALGGPIGLLAVTIPIWRYHRRLALADAASSDEGGLGAARRLYLYIGAFGIAVFLLINMSRLLTSFWEGIDRLPGPDTIGGQVWATTALPAYFMAAVVLLAVWWWHRDQADRSAGRGDDVGLDERRSLLRRLYLYGIVFVCIVVCVVNASTLLDDLMRAALGAVDPSGTGRSLLGAIGQPLCWGLVYGAFWQYHRWLLQREADRADEVGDQAALRRLYYYLVAAIGLTVFVIGVIQMLTTLLSVASLTVDQLIAAGFRDRISQATTLVVIGLPVWLGHWLHQQALSADPRIAESERASLWRRLYLYLALFATVVAILVDAASLLYQLLLAALGSPPSPTLLEVIRTPLSVIVVAGVLLYYHWRALQVDLRAAAATAGQAAAIVVAVLLRASDPAQLDQVLGRLTELTDGQVDLAVLRGERLDRQVRDALRRWREGDDRK